MRTITCLFESMDTRSIEIGAGGWSYWSVAAIFRCVESETFWPEIRPPGVTPINTCPPLPFRNPQSTLPTLSSCDVDFFNSMHSDSPSDAMLWTSVRFMAQFSVEFQELESSISGSPENGINHS